MSKNKPQSLTFKKHFPGCTLSPSEDRNERMNKFTTSQVKSIALYHSSYSWQFQWETLGVFIDQHYLVSLI